MADIDLNFELEQDSNKPEITIEDVLAVLQSEQEQDFDETVIYGLSGLTDADLRKLQNIRSRIDNGYWRLLLQTLVDVSESHFDLDYDALGFASLNDIDAVTRQMAIELLRENESSLLMYRLIDMAQNDASEGVRAEAVRALARFVLRGEFGKLPDTANTNLINAIIDILNNDAESMDVRRRAVEAIGNSSHEIVPDVIQAAYASEDSDVRLSAIIAMGRSCDPVWEQDVLKELENEDVAMQREAAFAAGELQLEAAVDTLIEMSVSETRELQVSAIQALGEIGSKEATRMLNKLLDDATERDDGLLMDVIEDALGAASLVSGDMLMLDFDADMLEDFE